MNTLLRSLALLLGAGVSLAQTPAVGAGADSGVVPWSALLQRPRLLDTTLAAGVHYPAILFEANVEGEVRLDAVITQQGAVEANSVRVLASTHAMFESAVKRALQTWRFTPPALGDRAVAVKVRVRVAFELPNDQAAPREDVTRVETDSVGIRVAVGSRAFPPTPGIAMSLTDSIAARVAVMLAFANPPPRAEGKRPVVCFRWDSGNTNVPSNVFARIKAKAPSGRNANACPETYTSMILQLDAQGRPIVAPPGYIDPIWVQVSSLRLWAPDLVVASATTWQGTSGSDFTCEAHRRQNGDDWAVACRRLRVWVSSTLTEHLSK